MTSLTIQIRDLDHLHKILTKLEGLRKVRRVYRVTKREKKRPGSYKLDAARAIHTVAAFLAGAMNSIAGGGSFLSFPALILAGVPSIPANATNSAAMWVGTIGGARAYWGDVRTA